MPDVAHAAQQGELVGARREVVQRIAGRANGSADAAMMVPRESGFTTQTTQLMAGLSSS